MKHLHLLLPDLLLPHDVMPRVCAGMELPVLNRLMARGTRMHLPHREPEAVLCEYFSAQGMAAVRAGADGLDVADGYWLCADPVHLGLQQSQALLQPEVACEREEAAALCAALNRHFGQDGLTFFAPHPQRWYVRAEAAAEVSTTPLRSASWRDVKAYQPQGKDALRWRSLSNEIQMLLHTHAVNRQREERGAPTINSVWLWGEGQARALSTKLDVLGGDASLCVPFCQVGERPYCATVGTLLEHKAVQGLWVETRLATAWQQGDLYAWREALASVEREVIHPMWQALRRGEVQSLTLDVSSEQQILRCTLDRMASWKIWRGRGEFVFWG